jgi:hypothetical protein
LHGELLAQGEVLEGELAVAVAEEREESKQVKQHADHGTAIVSWLFFWVWLSRVWTKWRDTLVIVAPDTVLRWGRRRFREHWATLSGRPIRGRPPVSAEITALVTNMAEPCRGGLRAQLAGQERMRDIGACSGAARSRLASP